MANVTHSDKDARQIGRINGVPCNLRAWDISYGTIDGFYDLVGRVELDRPSARLLRHLKNDLRISIRVITKKQQLWVRGPATVMAVKASDRGVERVEFMSNDKWRLTRKARS